MNKKVIYGIVAVVLCIVLYSMCGGSSKVGYWDKNKILAGCSENVITPNAPSKVRVVIENSMSMKAYYVGDTKGKDITSTVTRFKGLNDSSQLYINKTLAMGYAADVIANMIKKNNFTRTTDIDLFIQEAIDSVCANKCDMICYVTDGIMSVDNQSDQSRKLTELGQRIKQICSNSNNSVAAAIYRYNGQFNGLYYYADPTTEPKSVTLSNCTRPYYVIVIGKKNAIRWLSTKGEQELNGYEACLFMGMYDYSGNNGLALDSAKMENYVKYRDKENTIQVSIQFANKNTSLSYLNTCGILTAESVELWNDDKKAVVDSQLYEVTINNGCLNIKFNDNNVQSIGNSPLNLSLRMKNTIPGNWQDGYCSEDDRNIKKGDPVVVDQETTFGLAYLVQGMYEALQSEPYVFNIPFKINYK